MATIDVEIAARSYAVSCRDGDEPHLRQLAAVVDRKAKEAAAALGSMGESRQLLFASLLLADELKEVRAGGPGAAIPEPQADPAVADALERLAERVERLAESLEAEARNP
jgi:cell division protein ZapA